MERYRIIYEKDGHGSFVFLYADNEEQARKNFEESFGTLGFEIRGIEATGQHLTREQVYSK